MKPAVQPPRLRTDYVVPLLALAAVAITMTTSFVVNRRARAMDEPAQVAATCPPQSSPWWQSDGERCRFVGLGWYLHAECVLDSASKVEWQCWAECDDRNLVPATNCLTGVLAYDGCRWACRPSFSSGGAR